MKLPGFVQSMQGNLREGAGLKQRRTASGKRQAPYDIRDNYPSTKNLLTMASVALSSLCA